MNCQLIWSASATVEMTSPTSARSLLWFTRDDLLLDRHRRIEIYLQFAHARRAPGQLHAELLPEFVLKSAA